MKFIEAIELELSPGADLYMVSEYAAALAMSLQKLVTFKFNGILCGTTHPGEKAEEIRKRYEAAAQERYNREGY